jgi:hypothetical protein
MSESEQYQQDQCDSARSDDDKKLIQLAMQEKSAKHKERINEQQIERNKNGNH